jgi:hypothetical protein
MGRPSRKEAFYWLVNLTLSPCTCLAVKSLFANPSLLSMASPEYVVS